jgi:hypothetical protein
MHREFLQLVHQSIEILVLLRPMFIIDRHCRSCTYMNNENNSDNLPSWYVFDMLAEIEQLRRRISMTFLYVQTLSTLREKKKKKKKEEKSNKKKIVRKKETRWAARSCLFPINNRSRELLYVHILIRNQCRYVTRQTSQ